MTNSFSLLPVFAMGTLSVLGSCTVTRQDSPEARQAQMFGLVQKFDRFDYNGDGYLTRSEMMEGVKESGNIRLTEDEWTKVMQAYDTNRDGRISQREAQWGADRGPGIFNNKR